MSVADIQLLLHTHSLKNALKQKKRQILAVEVKEEILIKIFQQLLTFLYQLSTSSFDCACVVSLFAVSSSCHEHSMQKRKDYSIRREKNYLRLFESLSLIEE